MGTRKHKHKKKKMKLYKLKAILKNAKCKILSRAKNVPNEHKKHYGFNILKEIFIFSIKKIRFNSTSRVHKSVKQFKSSRLLKEANPSFR